MTEQPNVHRLEEIRERKVNAMRPRQPEPTLAARHDHTVRRFSRDFAAIEAARSVEIAEAEARLLIAQVCATFDVPVPALAFNPRRHTTTGECWAPRSQRRFDVGEAKLRAWEDARRRSWPEHGQIRLGAITTLGTLAHELGHHLTHHRERHGTVAHGKVWVGWFDQALTELIGGGR